MVGLSELRQQALRASNQAVPPPQKGEFIIDTGSDMSVVDPSAVMALGLHPRSMMKAHTLSTGGMAVEFGEYEVGLYLHGPQAGKGFHIPNLPVMGATFNAPSHQGLIGRDILALGILIYSGATQSYSLAF